MSDRNPRQAPALKLPSAALHARTYTEPHPDSEKAVRYERRRVSKELEPIHHERVATASLDSPRRASEAHAIPTLASLRSRNTSIHSSTDGSREELRRYGSAISGASTQADTAGSVAGSARSRRTPHWYDPVTKFWTTQISLTIDEGAHRDHLALERTFLGYLRTSLILVMSGIITAQLFHLQHTSSPNPDFGFYKIGKPLSVTFISMAILIVLVGAVRFWKLQQALVRGKALAGGWEVLLVMGVSVLLLVGTFALALGVDIEKGLEGVMKTEHRDCEEIVE